MKVSPPPDEVLFVAGDKATNENLQNRRGNAPLVTAEI